MSIWIWLLVSLVMVPALLGAQEEATQEDAVPRWIPGVYVILDGSGSMWGQLADGTHKISAAREVLKGFTADDYAGRELAFRVYGHRREGDCSDSELVVPFSAPDEALAKMSSFADQVNPKGKTPISRSLRAALEDFGDRAGEIVLISDGIETCDEDPCALVREWREKNVAIRVHVVGLGLEEKERAAMACISEAAGTEYQDAQSADELASGLAQIQQEAAESLPPQRKWYALSISAANEAGEPLRVHGVARSTGSAKGEEIAVSSNGTFQVPVGETEVTVGVKTRNGNIYHPVTKAVDVAARGKTKIHFVVPEPPSVKAKFLERGETVSVSYVSAFQDGEEVLSFRAKDRTYLDPGTYEFRAKPNADNELSVTETVADGDHKEILFELTHTVHAAIKMVASGGQEPFRSNYELWQNGEKKYSVHRGNGVRALPGTYDLHLPLRLTPHIHEGLVLTQEDTQEFQIEVPTGYVTVIYQKADGTRNEDKRCVIERLEDGRYQSDRISPTGKKVPLVSGSYRVQGWYRMGEFDDVHFDIEVGDDKEVVLRSKT